MKKHLLIVMLGIAGALSVVGTVNAQVAGSVTVDVVVTEMREQARGWSVKKDLLGKVIYNDSGEKVGTVVDLIISPEKNISYLIIGAGGFVGMGTHDVAIPVVRIKDQAGRFVMQGATKDSLKAMPKFNYAPQLSKRDKFIAATEEEIAGAKRKAADIEKSAANATGDDKTKLDNQVLILRQNLQAAEDKLTEMKRAGEKKWQKFESEVSKAIDHLRQSIEK